MNKLAQAEIIAIILGAIGGIAAWIMAGRMGAGIILRIITSLATAGLCWYIPYKVSES